MYKIGAPIDGRPNFVMRKICSPAKLTVANYRSFRLLH